MPAIEFTHSYSYTPAADGISVPIALRSASEVVDLRAYVDTGEQLRKPRLSL